MADDRDRSIRLQLELAPDQPGLLAGLETWLQLGLLSEAQMLQLAETRLSCPLAEVPKPRSWPMVEPQDEVTNPFTSEDLEGVVPAAITDFLPPTAEPAATVPLPSSDGRVAGGRRSPTPSSLWVSRLMSELSVVWLLGLGVFLVVLSSAVLAATQWASFNALGQYLVLLAYTLVFWGVGLGCQRQANLQLTAGTLQLITLLLVPLNFWALDGLGVWQQPGGLGMGAIATGLLTLVALQVLRHRQSASRDQALALGLAYLQSGWSLPGLPTLAVYLGVLGSGGVALASGQSTPEPPPGTRQPWVRGVIIASLGLLLARALTVVAPAQWGQFGLAFGLYGAIWVWRGQRRLTPPASTEAGPGWSLPPDRWGIVLGRGLMLWGWLITLTDWLAQTFGVSVLGLGLRLRALGQFGKRRDLLVAYAIAIQLGFVGWALVPQTLRQTLMATLNQWAGYQGNGYVWLGLSLFPYTVGMVALGDWYWRHRQDRLARFSDGIVLGSALLLTVISAASGPVLVINLMASTLTTFVITFRRSPLTQQSILISYGLALATVVIAIGQRWPALPLERWVAVLFALAIVGLLLSRALPRPWGMGAWYYGLGLSALSYLLLWNYLIDHDLRSGLSVVGLGVPVVLTLIGRHRASLAILGLALWLTLGLPWTRLLGLGTATALTGWNSLFYRRRWVPVMAVGLALGLVVSGLADWGLPFPRQTVDWCLVMVGLIMALWGLWRWLAIPSRVAPTPPEGPSLPLASLYGLACDRWGHGLALGLLGFMTAWAGWLYLGGRSPQTQALFALVGLGVALGLRYWGEVQPLVVYLAGWSLELLLAEALGWRWGTAVALAVPTLGLGAITLALALVLRRSHPGLMRPLYGLTLAYTGLTLLLRLTTVTAWTGWLVVGAALLTLEIGRRCQQPLARWLALVGLSVGWYELVLYQLWGRSGGSLADGLILLAGVAVLIMGLYWLVAAHLAHRLQLPPVEWLWAAHGHWLVGTVLMVGTAGSIDSARAGLAWVGLAIAAALTLYALLQGRSGPSDWLQSGWVYAGLTELVGWVTLVRLTVPALHGLDAWWGVVACGVAVPIYWLPWSSWGWPQRPGRVMAAGVPLTIALLTQGINHIPTLWVLTGFYSWMAWHSRRRRISYLAVGCVVWALWLWLDRHAIQDSLATVLPLGLALLYVAQVDPALQVPSARGLRHGWRVVATGLILLTALLSERWTGLPVGMMGLGAISLGLLLRTRAFLYTGTLVFVLNALNQLIVLNTTYPLIKWVMGILVGVALIWVAADFERRRTRWLQLTQTWLQDLDRWQ